MRAIIFTLVLLVLYECGVLQSYEIVKIKKPVYRSIRFVDDIHGWIAGYKGVYYTEDGGKKWRKLPIVIGSATRYTVRAAVENTGWIAWADIDEAIIRSDTGLAVGKANSPEWRRITVPTQILERLYTLAFVNQRDGWGAGSGFIYRSTDGGNNWEAIDFQLKSPAKSIFAFSTNEIWVAGGLTTLAHTLDGALSFHYQRLNPGTTDDLLFITFIDVKNGWACGTNGLIYRTADGGNNWEQSFTELSNGVAFSSLSFVSQDEGWAIGSKYLGANTKGNILYQNIAIYTMDGGKTWLDRTPSFTDSLLNIQALPNGRAWVVGIDGVILQTSDGGQNWRSIVL